jgi:ParB family chromosome partitioning protein
MKDHKQTITQVETACVNANQVLALSVTPHDVLRCTRIIQQYGVLTPPVVGSFSDGTRLLLSGECEFQALREMGIKNVDAVTVSVTEEQEANELSLLLSSLKKSPHALSEGMLLLKLLKSGKYTQAQLGELLGKSVSWINKRFSLLTRLQPAVQELVTQRVLCPHSAQSIARLPQKIQHTFAMSVVREGLPKSAVEELSSAYNTKACPESLKKQILEQPRHALERISAIRTAKPLRKREEAAILSVQILRNDLALLLRCIQEGEKHLGGLSHEEISSQNALMLRCKKACIGFSSLLALHLESKKFSPGKMEEGLQYGN